MSASSDYFAGLNAAWLDGSNMPSAPAALYIALFNGDPTNAGTGGTEVTTSIRTAGRIAASFSHSGRILTSDADADFGNAANAVPSITHFAVYDAQSSGNMLGSNSIPGAPKAVSAGTQVIFEAGDLNWTF